MVRICAFVVATYCHGHVCARRPHSLRVAAWPVGVRLASGGHTIVFWTLEGENPRFFLLSVSLSQI